jgi:hypothetical protein
MLEKHCRSSLRNIKTAINYFLQMFRTQSTHISDRKILAEHWNSTYSTLGFSILKMSPLYRPLSWWGKSFILLSMSSTFCIKVPKIWTKTLRRETWKIYIFKMFEDAGLFTYCTVWQQCVVLLTSQLKYLLLRSIVD